MRTFVLCYSCLTGKQFSYLMEGKWRTISSALQASAFQTGINRCQVLQACSCPLPYNEPQLIAFPGLDKGKMICLAMLPGQSSDRSETSASRAP